MKKYVLLGLFLSFAAMNAQEDLPSLPPPSKEMKEKRKAEMIEMLKTELKLTADQVKKIEAIDVQLQAEEDAVEEAIKAAHEQRKALFQKRKELLKALLTNEQKVKLDSLKEAKMVKKEIRIERKNRGGSMPPPPPPPPAP